MHWQLERNAALERLHRRNLQFTRREPTTDDPSVLLLSPFPRVSRKPRQSLQQDAKFPEIALNQTIASRSPSRFNSAPYLPPRFPRKKTARDVRSVTRSSGIPTEKKQNVPIIACLLSANRSDGLPCNFNGSSFHNACTRAIYRATRTFTILIYRPASS